MVLQTTNELITNHFTISPREPTTLHLYSRFFIRSIFIQRTGYYKTSHLKNTAQYRNQRSTPNLQRRRVCARSASSSSSSWTASLVHYLVPRAAAGSSFCLFFTRKISCKRPSESCAGSLCAHGWSPRETKPTSGAEGDALVGVVGEESITTAVCVVSGGW